MAETPPPQIKSTTVQYVYGGVACRMSSTRSRDEHISRRYRKRARTILNIPVVAEIAW